MSNVKIVNDDFRNHIIPAGLVITDPPYNQGYAYNQYKDRMSEEEYINLLSKIPGHVSLFIIQKKPLTCFLKPLKKSANK